MAADRPAPGTPVAVDLITPDVEAAQSFYGPLLGWRFEGTGDRVECRADGAVAAGLLPASAAPVAGWRTSLQGNDPDATVERVRQAGGEVLAVADGLVHAADPAGATFAVAHGSAREPVQPGPGLPAWHEVMTRDPEQADAFYTAVLGYGVLNPPDGPEGYALFTVDQRPVAGRLVMPADLFAQVGPRWMAYFVSPDVDGAAARVPELGGIVAAPPMDTPTGRLAAVVDPSGAMFTLLRPAR